MESSLTLSWKYLHIDTTLEKMFPHYYENTICLYVNYEEMTPMKLDYCW